MCDKTKLAQIEAALIESQNYIELLEVYVRNEMSGRARIQLAQDMKARNFVHGKRDRRILAISNVSQMLKD